MEHVSKRLSCEAVNKMDMVDYLTTIGIQPTKIKGNDYWYTSPFREESTPSFKIDRKLNRWYDHGEGKGGKLVDFAVEFYHCSVGELLRKLSGNLSLPTPGKLPSNFRRDEGNHIEIIGAKPLTNLALLQYAESRAITGDLIKKYCEEISYLNGGKKYYALGFKNDLGGYELRSKYFKGSSSPKGITHFKNGSNKVSVFEGFFNFLSFQKLQQNPSFPKTDFIILNSLSFFKRAKPTMEGYREANLYLDNNVAGQKFTAQAVSLNSFYKDKSSLYEKHEDLNDFLKSQSKELSQAIIRKPRLRM